jgi:NitT/TauT family transport system ATP-binding protein
MEYARLTEPFTSVNGRPSAIRLEDISVTFGSGNKKVEAIGEVSLDIAKGEFVSLIGHSGCGKSTLLRVIADIIQPTTGRAEILGTTPSIARQNRSFSMVFQQSVLLPWATVMENVTLPFQVGPQGGATKSDAGRMHVDEALRLVELDGFENHYPAQLSGGMRQRVAIARALVTRPEVLLMDEPFGALDELVRDSLNVELLNIWRRSGTTIVFVTHSLQEAAFLSQRVVVMSRRPSRIAGILDVELPDERHIELKDAPELGAHVARLRAMLDEG